MASSHWDGLVHSFLASCKSDRVNLIELSAAQSKPLVLLVDIDSFIEFILDRFKATTEDESPFLDDAPLLLYEFSEYSKLKAIILSLMFLLHENHIQLEFIDGSSQPLGAKCQKVYHEHSLQSTYQCIRTVESLRSSHSLLDICSCFGSPMNHWPLPILIKNQVEASLKEMGYRIWASLDLPELMMMAIVQQRNRTPFHSSSPASPLRNLLPVFAVCSNRSEFILLKDALRWIPLKLFDPLNRLVQLVQSIVSESPFLVTQDLSLLHSEKVHYLVSLEAHIVQTQHLTPLTLLTRQHLLDSVILCGNRFTTPFYHSFPHQFPDWPKASSLPDLVKVALDCLDSHEDTLNSRIKTLFTSAQQSLPGFSDAVQLSHAFYQYQDIEPILHVYALDCFTTLYPFWWHRRNVFSLIIRLFNQTVIRSTKNTHHSSSPIQHCFNTILDILVHTHCLPFWLYQAYTQHVYYRPPHVESIQTPNTFVIEDILLDLRCCCYGILADPSQTITEYGRSADELYGVKKVYPVRLPPRLTLQELLTDTFHSSAACSHFSSFQQFIRHFSTTLGHTHPPPCWNSSCSFLQLYLYVLSILRCSNESGDVSHLCGNSDGPTSPPASCFEQHELESLVVSIIATSSRYDGHHDSILTELIQASTYLKQIYAKLCKEGFDLRVEDPLNLSCVVSSKRSYEAKTRYVLYGLVPSYRSTVVFGLFQLVWKYLVEIACLYHSAVHRTTEPLFISPSLVFDGKIFAWIYAAGTVEHSQQTLKASSLPFFPKTHPSVHSRMKMVSRLRSSLLKTHLAKCLLSYLQPRPNVNNLFEPLGKTII